MSRPTAEEAARTTDRLRKLQSEGFGLSGAERVAVAVADDLAAAIALLRHWKNEWAGRSYRVETFRDTETFLAQHPPANEQPKSEDDKP